MVDADDQPDGGRIEHGEHRMALRVYWEDTDAGGVAYHATYLRWMERGRTEMLRLCGIAQRESAEAGAGQFVVADLAIRYRRPVRLDDALLLVSRIVRVGGALIGVHQRVMRGRETAADADVTAAFTTPTGRPRRLPAAWAGTFRRLQGEACPR